MARKKKTPQEELREAVNSCYERYHRWEKARKNGVPDPYWCDGMNLNLLRNHISYEKGKIRNICEKHKLPFPAIFYRPLPVKKHPDFIVEGGVNKNGLGKCS